MDSISKLCADHLRTFISKNYSIKLKASHAHEFVAACFGYKSNAALNTDTIAPINNLPQAKIVVLAPKRLIEERRKSLQDLPPDLPDSQVLLEIIYTTLISHHCIIGAPWAADELIAISLADEYLRERKMENIYRAPIREGVTIEAADNHKQLLVSRFYQLPIQHATSFLVREVKITTCIKLPRIAGRIGYGKPEISAEIVNLGTRP